MTGPLISVLLPCYNGGAWIHDAIQSVLAQTYQHFEIVVVDDGSTDELTRSTLNNLARLRTQVIRTENRGLPAARNEAARHARGDLFCALDADDRLAPAWFEKGVALLNGRPDLAFVSHWLETFGDEQWTWTPERCDLPALLARNTVNGAALVRREAFEQVGGYDERMRSGCEDWDFWLRLVERGYRGEIIPEVLFYYRRRPRSMSREMTAASTYREPLEQLVERHQEAYSRHLVSVMIAKEREKLALQREVNGLVRDRLVVLEPSLARAEEERAAILDKVERARVPVQMEQDREQLRFENRELRREVADLRSSWSWKVTAPLRWLYARLPGSRT